MPPARSGPGMPSPGIFCPIRPDGCPAWIARPPALTVDSSAVVERLPGRPWDGHPDRAALEKLARFDPHFHTTRLTEAENADDDFAAAFHLRQLLHQQPWDASLLVKQAHLLA